MLRAHGLAQQGSGLGTVLQLVQLAGPRGHLPEQPLGLGLQAGLRPDSLDRGKKKVLGFVAVQPALVQLGARQQRPQLVGRVSVTLFVQSPAGPSQVLTQSARGGEKDRFHFVALVGDLGAPPRQLGNSPRDLRPEDRTTQAASARTRHVRTTRVFHPTIARHLLLARRQTDYS